MATKTGSVIASANLQGRHKEEREIAIVDTGERDHIIVTSTFDDDAYRQVKKVPKIRAFEEYEREIKNHTDEGWKLREIDFS